MSEENHVDPLKSLDTTESVEATIALKVEKIKSELASSKQNIAEEDVDGFIQMLTGFSEVLKMTSKTEACSKPTNVLLLKDITGLLQKLAQFKGNLTETREVRSKIIHMETEIMKHQVTWANWHKLPLADQTSKQNKIRTSISGIMKEIDEMQCGTQYNSRLDALFNDCSQILQEMELTISKIETFNVQFLELQRQYEAILRSVKSSSDIAKALLNLKEIKSRAENLVEIRDESRAIKDDMINSINQEIEKFTNILENDNLINPLQELSAMWQQIEHNLYTKKFKADSVNKAQMVLNEIRNSIDTSIKVLEEKTGQREDNVFQRKFKEIKNQVHSANIEDDGSQFLQLAKDLRKLHSQITDHQSLLKEIQNYADTLETEANNLNYLNGIEAKADEIDDLFRNGVNHAAIQVELERFRNMLNQNYFKTSLSRLEKRNLNLIQRVRSQVFRLEKLKVKDREDNNKAEEILLEVKEMLKILEPQVKTFVGTRNENLFQLSELLTRNILQLDGIKIPNDQIQTRKVSLLKTLHELGDVLERRSAAVELVDQLNTRIKDTLIIIQHTDHFTGDEQFKEFETTLKELRNQRELVMKECYTVDGLKEKFNECDENLNLLEEFKFMRKGY